MADARPKKMADDDSSEVEPGPALSAVAAAAGKTPIVSAEDGKGNMKGGYRSF